MSTRPCRCVAPEPGIHGETTLSFLLASLGITGLKVLKTVALISPIK